MGIAPYIRPTSLTSSAYAPSSRGPHWSERGRAPGPAPLFGPGLSLTARAAGVVRTVADALEQEGR